MILANFNLSFRDSFLIRFSSLEAADRLRNFLEKTSFIGRRALVYLAPRGE